ncbi:MAG: Y-family DNA polymerase [Bacteroidales bacterium]|nr:Y-family DNA polymerase [Bacteroidales bacterium]
MHTFVHIDCNSFFASCEVATNPELAGRPVVVANDNEVGGGILLALTAEAKALGLKRGTPVFQCRRLMELNHVVVCQADHKKYRRISRQIMDCVQQQAIVLDFVQYSVDEFFGRLPIDDPNEVRHYVKIVKDHIEQTSGVPVSCGCSQSYTLAKVATHYAKHYKGYKGICVLTPDKRDRALSMLPIGDVWGIGRQNRQKLERLGVRTALDFVRRDEKEMQRLFSTTGLRTYWELQGRPCINLDRPEMQRSISQSRTFGKMIEDKASLAEHIRAFVSDCATKLRAQGGLCSSVTVFVATNRHREDLPQYNNGATCKLAVPTSDTPTLIQAALSQLTAIFRRGYLYKQAGVILSGITPAAGSQLDLFTAPEDERRRKLMQVTDEINAKFGDDTVEFG